MQSMTGRLHIGSDSIFLRNTRPSASVIQPDGWVALTAFGGCPTVPLGRLGALSRERPQTGKVDGTNGAPSRWMIFSRLAITAAILITLLFGSLWGQDSGFPFGPFRMFSTRDDPNSSVVVTEIIGITATGQHLTITGDDIGLRRAEIEGQLNDLQQHPDGLARIATAYQHRHTAAQLARVQLVQQKYQLHDGRAANKPLTTVLADWRMS